MRGLSVTLAIFSVLIFTACGGKKPPEQDLPLQSEMVGDSIGTAGEQRNTEIADEDVESVDEGKDIGDVAIKELNLTDMTIEEINAAEFLSNVYFEFNKFRLTDGAMAQLNQNGRWLVENPAVRVIIEGHCDERGTEEYNLALGERRANSAREYLVRLGISPERLMTVSYGESRPMVLQSNEAAWDKNRRAHFRIYER